MSEQRTSHARRISTQKNDKQENKLVIFDRDGTLIMSENATAMYYAWQKLCEDNDLDQPPLTLKEMYYNVVKEKNFYEFGANGTEVCERICGQRLKDKNNIGKLAKDLETLYKIIKAQILFEQDVFSLHSSVIQLKGGKEDFIKDVCGDPSFIDKIIEKTLGFPEDDMPAEPEYYFEHLSTEKQQEAINACEQNDNKKIAGLYYEEKLQDRESRLEKVNNKLWQEKVFKPFTVPFGFVPEALSALKKLKKMGVNFALNISSVTTGGFATDEGTNQLFDKYRNLQFKIATGQTPDEFFDFYTANPIREKGFEEVFAYFKNKGIDISPQNAVAIGDDVISNHRTSKSLGLSEPIAINYYREKDDFRGQEYDDVWQETHLCESFNDLNQMIVKQLCGQEQNKGYKKVIR